MKIQNYVKASAINTSKVQIIKFQYVENEITKKLEFVDANILLLCYKVIITNCANEDTIIKHEIIRKTFYKIFGLGSSNALVLKSVIVFVSSCDWSELS